MSNRLRFILAWDIGVMVALLAMLIGLRNAHRKGCVPLPRGK